AFQRPAFEREAVAIPRRVVPRRPAETEHRVLLGRLELGAPDQVRVLVRLEVARSDDHWVRMVDRRDSGERARQAIDEELRLVVVAARQGLDAAARLLVGSLGELRVRLSAPL